MVHCSPCSEHLCTRFFSLTTSHAKGFSLLAQLKDISLSFPDKTVLENVSLTIYPDDRIILFGENGSGKTSLFRILTGRLKPNSGTVSLSRGLRIGHLEQDFAALEDDATCLGAALEPFEPLIQLEQRMAYLSENLGQAGDEETERLLAELGEAQQRFEATGGYGFRARTGATLTGLGLPEPYWGRRVEEMSAGERMRLALARILLGGHDLILFDEPTNHLDIPAREWLEEHLARTNRAYVVASHDRRFLDAVGTKVAHLDRGELRLYAGNYTAFREQRGQEIEAGWRSYEKGQKKIRKLKEQAQTYRSWSNAREKDKRGAADRGFVGHRAAKLMKRSLVARRRLEEEIERAKTTKPFEKDRIKIDFRSSKGRSLLLATDLAVGYAGTGPLAEGIDIDLSSGDRLAILGPNGCGKTALLRTLLGEIPALSGESKLAPSARVGYFDQDNRRLPRADTALGAVQTAGRDETLVRTVLGRMGVRRETVNKPTGKLSSGERAKVLLAKLILGDHNLLVLDEPTNHLDVETQDVLLGALQDFPGGILFVSHDRYFIDALATQTLALG
jgi:ATP-binding cassette subfamily F protein 3